MAPTIPTTSNITTGLIDGQSTSMRLNAPTSLDAPLIFALPSI